MEIKVRKVLILSILVLSSLANAESFKLKLHKMVSENCRVMFFQSQDDQKFFLEKFNANDPREFKEYSDNPIKFAAKDRQVFGYEETLGHKSKNHIISLIDGDVVLKYVYVNKTRIETSEEVTLFQSVSCE